MIFLFHKLPVLFISVYQLLEEIDSGKLRRWSECLAIYSTMFCKKFDDAAAICRKLQFVFLMPIDTI